VPGNAGQARPGRARSRRGRRGGLSYFLGAEIAKRIGNIGAKAVLGVIVIVVIGLAIRAGVSRWRATRQARPA
jgi:hypothetical protein